MVPKWNFHGVVGRVKCQKQAGIAHEIAAGGVQVALHAGDISERRLDLVQDGAHLAASDLLVEHQQPLAARLLHTRPLGKDLLDLGLECGEIRVLDLAAQRPRARS